MPTLTVFITTYNRLDYTRRTIESLFPNLPMGTKVYIQDNGSTDGTIEYLEKLVVFAEHIPKFEVILSGNVGWGKAINELMDYAKPTSDYILIANNDVEGWSRTWYADSIKLYEKYPDIGLLAMWSHINHGKLQDLGDLIVKDQMPAVAWLIKRERMLRVPEYGPCPNKGGNGEDATYCNMVVENGWWVTAPMVDFAHHIDWY